MTSGFCTAWLSNLSLADVSVSYLLACVWSSNKLQLSEGIGCCRGQPPWPLCTLGPRQGTHQDTFPMASPVLGTIQWWHKSPLTPGTALSPFSSKVTHSLPLGDEKKPPTILGHSSAISLLFPAPSKPLLLLTKIISHLHFLLALLNYMCLHLLQSHKAE